MNSGSRQIGPAESLTHQILTVYFPTHNGSLNLLSGCDYTSSVSVLPGASPNYAPTALLAPAGHVCYRLRSSWKGILCLSRQVQQCPSPAEQNSSCLAGNPEVLFSDKHLIKPELFPPSKKDLMAGCLYHFCANIRLQSRRQIVCNYRTELKGRKDSSTYNVKEGHCLSADTEMS